MPRRSSPSDGFDSRDVDAAIDASIAGFQKLNRKAQIAVVIVIVCLAIAAGIVYLRYQQSLATAPNVASANLLLGNPSGANGGDHDNYLMVKPYFVLSYNDHKGTPNWVSWEVKETDLGDAPRKQVFDFDADLPVGLNVVKTSDYAGSGFDRGHMCPHSDRAANTDMSYATFVMTNIIPQAPNVNQKAWAQFENYCRDLVKAHTGRQGDKETRRQGDKETRSCDAGTRGWRGWWLIMASGDLLDRLRAAIDGLTYPSESDEPFDVVRWDNPKGADISSVLVEHVGKGRAIREVPVAEFFGQLEDADEVLRYRALRATLESSLNGVRAFRAGDREVRVDVYVLGLSKIDELIVGVHSVSVET